VLKFQLKKERTSGWCNPTLALRALKHESALFLTVAMEMLECSSWRWEFGSHIGLQMVARNPCL